jgi:nicotinamide-nucleotide amidase
MDLELISIGSELLTGHTVNSNAAFLSQHLVRLGYRISRHTVLPDQTEIIQQGLREALQRVSLVITTGGLGPTIDDLTQGAVNKIFPKQTPLMNKLGTASGAFYHQKNQGFILLPGVPREMECMFLEEAVPLIKTHFPVHHPLYRKTCSFCLLREIEVNPILLDMKRQEPTVEIGIYPSQGTLSVEFLGFEMGLLEQMAKQLQKRFSAFYFAAPTIVQAVHQECIQRKKTLALAESCTGGAMAAKITAIPDASLYFLGSLVVYSNPWKEHFLQVSHSTLAQDGAVSRQAVDEMIQGLFHETKADFAIAVSGIAGPGGGSSKKPVGTICIAIGERGQKTDIGVLQAPQDRASAIEWAVQTSLGALWRRLVHKAYTFS